MSKKEIRCLPCSIAKRADGSSGLVGTAIRYGQMSEDLGGFREKFAPGAFRAHLAGQPKVCCLVNHETRLVLSRTPDSLRLTDTDEGLQFDSDLPPTTYAADLVIGIERGLISGMSFAFDAEDTVWDEVLVDNRPTLLRTVMAARLYEISPVTFPAYPQTEVALRSMQEHLAKAEAKGRPNAMRHLLLDVLERAA